MSAAGTTQPAAMPDGEATVSPPGTAPAEVEEAEEAVGTDQAPVVDDAAREPGSDGDYTGDEDYLAWDDYERQPVSKLAVAALVCGLLAILPLALGFGIAALAVIRRTGRRGYRMAVAGIYASWIWVLVAAAAFVLVHFTHGFHTRVNVQYQPAAAYSLQPGDCLNGDPNQGSFTIVSCSASHQAEVYGRFSLTGTGYPGSTAVQQQVISGCATELTSYVNPQFASIGFSEEYVYPDKQAWTEGVRTVICEARFTSGSMSGSIRKA